MLNSKLPLEKISNEGKREMQTMEREKYRRIQSLSFFTSL